MSIDGNVTKSKELLTNIYKVSEFLIDLCKWIGMTPIKLPPEVIRYDGPAYGISGNLFLAESNICIHTYPESDYMYLDIFSCRVFDSGEVRKKLIDKLGLSHIQSSVSMRGYQHLVKGIRWTEE